MKSLSKKQPRPSVRCPFRQVLPERFFIEEIRPVPRLIGYARVSTEEQDMSMQVTKLVDAGVDAEFDLFCDKLSATNMRRPYFALMKKHLQSGDTLLVYSVSRLFRDAEKLLSFFGEMKAKGIEIRSITENLDLKTSHGRMIATILAAVDQNERERIRERTKDGMAERKRQGQMMGRPRKVDDAMIAKMKAMRKHATAEQVASRFKVSIASVNKYAPKSAAA